MRHEKGFAVVMSKHHDPQTPNGGVFLFGPATSSEVKFRSENITSNGLELFREKKVAERAAIERKRRFGREFSTILVVKMELVIANPEEWEELRSHGSYIVGLGDVSKLELYGTPWVNGSRVKGAFDSWASFSSNGAHPFTDFGALVGEFGLGTLSELARQAQCRVLLIGVKINWSPADH